MKKRRETIRALTKGVRHELRERAIVVDKTGHARRGGKFIGVKAVVRAVNAIRRALSEPRRARKTTPIRLGVQEQRRAPKTSTGVSAAPKGREAPTRPRRHTLHSKGREAPTRPRQPLQDQKRARKRERELQLRAERAEAELKKVRAEASKREKQLRAELKAERQAAKQQGKALEARLSKLEKATKALTKRPPAVPPPPPAAPPKKPPKKPKKPRKPAKPVELTDRDAAILASWDSLDFDQQARMRAELSPDGLRELERREQVVAGGAFPGMAMPKTPSDLREDLQRALRRKGVKRLLAETVDNSAVRKVEVPAWEGQHRATMRHPNMIVQTDREAAAASRKANIPKRQRGTKYHATIIAVTQHPPMDRYGPSTITGNEDLFVIYIAAQSASSPTELRRNIAFAIREVLKNLPGGAPLYVAAIEVRTSKGPRGKR